MAVEPMNLTQRAEVMAQQQRLVGNLRAQARREGVVVEVPQLYVYHGDGSAAYHLDGFRPGFERELTLTIDRGRRARSMVRLDRLLERVTDAEGQAVSVTDLPDAQTIVVLVRRRDCASCDQVAAVLDAWSAERAAVLRITVLTDRLP